MELDVFEKPMPLQTQVRGAMLKNESGLTNGVLHTFKNHCLIGQNCESVILVVRTDTFDAFFVLC